LFKAGAQADDSQSGASIHVLQALIHGLNRHYYSIGINYRKNELEEKMLLNLHKKKWTDGLNLQRFDTHAKTNEKTVTVGAPSCFCTVSLSAVSSGWEIKVQCVSMPFCVDVYLL
jgi:hypothetical protein